MNRVISYPVHKQAVLIHDLKVRVKAGDEEWITLPTYRVKVDMHDVHEASMAYFDFEGEVLVEISGPWYIYHTDIRPLSKDISHNCDTKKVVFKLSDPANLSIELNKDRYHNLHLFAGKKGSDIPGKEDENTLVISGDMTGLRGLGGEIIRQLEAMPEGRCLYMEPGIYYITESILKIPSNTNIYLAGGCTLVGGLVCSDVENIRIYGRGIIYQADFQRYGGINGIRISHSKSIKIEDIIIINPPHYTVYIGGSKEISINNIKAFSCEGWSDGIDIMSSENITIEGGFLRNSDDCIAIYGNRWSYAGNTKNINVQGLTVWADVAHPLNIGTHGDYEGEGNIIENINFKDIDILEHNEYQAGYLGCMTINAGDKNTVRNIKYENIRIEPFKHGKLLDIQVKRNPDYNPKPGKLIENIMFNNIYYQGPNEVTSVINGYNEKFMAKNISLNNIWINNEKADSFIKANIEVGKFTDNITIE
jgi:hypothetical protein